MSHEFCRFCLKIVDLHPIFLNVSENERYSEILQITTGLNIHLNDGLPQSICSECTENINSNLKFRNLCHQTEIELFKLGFIKVHEKHNNETYPEGYEESDEFIVKEEESKTGVLLPDDIQIPELEINIELQRLTQDNFNEEATHQSPTSSGNEVKKEVIITKNKSKREKRKELLSLVDGEVEKNKPVKCKVCGKILKTWASFVSHAKLHLGFKFVCEFCGKSFISSTQLNRHCRSHHGMERSLKCNMCDYKALDNTQLSLHIRRIHTGQRPYTCDNCGASYFSRRCLIQHLETHRHSHVVQCNICGGVFKSKRHLSRHTYIVHTRKLYKYRCTICGRVYASPKYARVHITKHHGRPPYPGDVDKIHA